MIITVRRSSDGGSQAGRYISAQHAMQGRSMIVKVRGTSSIWYSALQQQPVCLLTTILRCVHELKSGFE